MKCAACGTINPLNKWRVVNITPSTGRVSDRAKPGAVSYYPSPGRQMYTNLYACPRCGTVRIRTPLDRN